MDSMDLIIKARGKVTVVTIEGNLKVITADKHEIRFHITGGEENIRKASKILQENNIWHNPYPHYLGIPFEVGETEKGYKAEVQFNL